MGHNTSYSTVLIFHRYSMGLRSKWCFVGLDEGIEISECNEFHIFLLTQWSKRPFPICKMFLGDNGIS